VALARSADAAERAARVGTRCAGAAARLLGVVGRVPLATALATELASVGGSGADEGVLIGLEAYDAMAEYPPEWVEPRLEAARRGASIVSRPANSTANPTGLWRTLRPVIAADKCHRCWWVCGTLCPDNCILIGADGRPSIDYVHCKGCLVCAMQCPHRAIDIVPEPRALEVPA
jgi:pyruvate ferredoxin oxidoreductase gamma subunit